VRWLLCAFLELCSGCLNACNASSRRNPPTPTQPPPPPHRRSSDTLSVTKDPKAPYGILVNGYPLALANQATVDKKAVLQLVDGPMLPKATDAQVAIWKASTANRGADAAKEAAVATAASAAAAALPTAAAALAGTAAVLGMLL